MRLSYNNPRRRDRGKSGRPAALARLGGSLVLARNDALACLGLASLSELGGQIRAVDNPSLPTCEVWALAERLATEDGGPEVTTRRNDDDATCR